MPNHKTDPSTETPPLAGLQPPAAREGGLTAADLIGLVLSLLWLAVFGWLFWSSGAGNGGAGQTAMVAISLVLPVALIWFAVLSLRASRLMRDEARRLQAMLDAMRQAYLVQAQNGQSGGNMDKRLEEIARAARNAEQAVAMFVSVRDMPAATAPIDRKSVMIAPKKETPAVEQPALALGVPPEISTSPLTLADTIRALNFPDGPEDHEGFRALRRALGDPQLSRIVRAAQDVLTLLSQDGIYMDDLMPDRARPELWRRFAQGERGRTLAGLGGIRDRSSLALSAGRMRQDTIFRDAAHHFLRQFDKTLVEIEKSATDADIASLSDTRTARAFMLLGRVAGVFD